MRRAALCLIVLTLTAPLPVAAEHDGVHIVEILPAPNDGQREFVELHNAGPAVDLTGWTLRDTADNTYTFEALTLPAGGRLVLWGGGVGDSRGPAWSKAVVWNNGGDQVILQDAAGQVVDVFAYGSAAWPDGRSAPVPAAPPAGRSLSLVDGAWVETSPTPGAPTSTGGGTASATVQDVAPSVVLDAPTEVRGGAMVEFLAHVSDGNGDADIAAWNLTADGVVIANGSTAGSHLVTAAAPTDRDAWQLSLRARDHGGQEASVVHVVALRVAGLAILIPAEGLAFPAFPPGAAEVLANGSFTLRNDGSDAITPRIDISDLTGPDTIPIAGRLDIGNTTWTTYDGPLTALPTLQPGDSVDLRLRLRDIPSPLAAGTYGTSFTVIA